MPKLILIVDDTFIKNFNYCESFPVINVNEFIEAAIFAQMSENHPYSTDQQDSLFEIAFEPMLSDNTMTITQYEEMRLRYVNATCNFNLLISSLIEPHVFNKSYTDLNKRDKNTYVFYRKE